LSDVRAPTVREGLAGEAAGTVIGGYVIEGKVGAGAMSSIYRARHPDTGHVVAIKVLEAATGDPDRFLREAKLLASLRHPAIVRYLDHGHTPKGQLYLAMQWLDGEDLGQRLARGGLTMAESVVLCLRVAGALAEAHERRIVHRDVKPANIFLPGGSLDEAVLLDFGVARPERATEQLTVTGALIGTPSYMAPEQVRGEPVCARADVFALGCVLYECLAGRPAFLAEHVLGVLARVLFQQPAPITELRPEVPAALAELVASTLAKRPEERPADAAAVAAALAALGHLEGGTPPRHARPPALSTAEQRLVSVVIAGHPEGAPEHELHAAASRYGASLERVTSGILVAALTARASATDQADDAANLALALSEVIPLAPIAVATGRGVVGGTLPVGEAVDRGAQLLSTGAPGVWLDEVTEALLRGRFEIDEGGRLCAAGAEPRSLSTRPEARSGASARRLLGKPTPFVGREHELAVLDAAWADGLARSAARVVLITAPAGVGKSRLLYEWLRRLDARAEPVRVLRCRGERASAGTPHVLAAQLLRRSAGIDDGATDEAQRIALESTLRGHLDAAELPRALSFLGELLGLASLDSEELRAARASPLLMGDQIRLAFADWLAAASAAEPLVVVLEDLHWGDRPSIKLLDAGLRAVRDRPIILIATARPEIKDIFPALWTDRGVQEIGLRELSPAACEELARSALGPDIEPETAAWIAARAGGHALYLEELIRAVAEGAPGEVPASVLAMVQVRLAALPAQARRVLRAASVFGEVFWRGAVAALLGLDRTEVAETLDELASGEVIVWRRASRFPGEAEFTFGHALFREAAEAMLTDEDRALGHRLAADWLIAAGERQPLVLADHLERAGAAKEAVPHLAQAAEDALWGNDFAAALELAARGLGRLDTINASDQDKTRELVGRLRLVEADAHLWIGDAADIEGLSLQAIEHLSPGTSRWFDAIRTALTAHLPARRPLLDRLLAWLETPPGDADEDTRAFVMAAVSASKHLSFHGEHETSWRMLERAESVAAAMPPADSVHGWTLRARGWANLFDGRHDAALRADLSASRHFEEIGDLRNVCSLGINIGWLQATELGLHADAERSLRRSWALAERLGLGRSISVAKQNLGVALMHLGRLEEARRLLIETVGEFELSGEGRLSGGSRFYLTTLESLAGNFEQAEAEARAGLELAKEVPTTTACINAALARALVAAGRPGDALACARAAAAILDELGGIEEGESLILLALAEAQHASGQTDNARETIARARARLEERAEAIEDPDIRRGFLQQVPEHARTFELARELEA
jgi:eukaryotic-like serine/threonine-protein kinase